MSDKPVIFISYSHKDEPDQPRGDEVAWLSFVRTYLQPAIKNGVFDLWVDRHMVGGTDWDPEIEARLRTCDIFILLVSANSMASDYIVDKEIAIIRQRQAKGEPVHFYPLLLTPTPDTGLEKVRDKNLRPRDARPFSGFPPHERMQQMTDAANEIGKIAKQTSGRKEATRLTARVQSPAYVHITGLPETAYERLVGREGDLQRLDDAWGDRKTNILSLVAEGGAGKSALVNEWLRRLQADNYRGAQTVLGWSFYSQGSKERATAADEFLNWALVKLEIELETSSATVKAEAIAEVMMRRRVLLLLDGVEPLQHGLDAHLGRLKDQGLRALLRRHAATPSEAAHGLIVLTSRIAVKDIGRWQTEAAPLINVERLSDLAGAELLRDSGVWGVDKELNTAVRDFGGHPLALGLLASFLKETQTGDVRRRDHIRAYTADTDNPRHDHVKRVMESYEKEWLAGQPALLAIMYLVGLFDRPASPDCIQALRKKPPINGLTDRILNLNDDDWQRLIARLREVQLLAPTDMAGTETLDAHPLVREWFSERLRQANGTAWRTAHSVIYNHLRRTTREGNNPTIGSLAPLYQAIIHGCHAGLHKEVLNNVYFKRIARLSSERDAGYYSVRQLGAFSSDLAAISRFFDKPYEVVSGNLAEQDQAWLLGQAGAFLRIQGRLDESIKVLRANLELEEDLGNWDAAATSSINLCEAEFLAGRIDLSVEVGERSVAYSARGTDWRWTVATRTSLANSLAGAGKQIHAEELFQRAEGIQKNYTPNFPLLHSLQGYQFCDILLDRGNWSVARDRAQQTLQWALSRGTLSWIALDSIMLVRARTRMLLNAGRIGNPPTVAATPVVVASTQMDDGVSKLSESGANDLLPIGLLARAAFRRSIGGWSGSARDLDEVEEIAEPGPMRLYLCDMALERARLTFAQTEAFAPLNGMLEKDNPPKPEVPSAEEIAKLNEEAAKQIRIADDYIQSCGYHRRDEELAELYQVLKGEKKFASLPPRV